MISQQEVGRIAELARLKLNDRDVSKMQKDLADILDYIKLLEEADTAKTEPFSMSIFAKTEMRQDECLPADKETTDALVNQIPFRHGRLAKVKEILK